MALIDEVKRRAAQARFEADRAMRANRARSHIGTLNAELSTGTLALGRKALEVAGHGEALHPALQEILTNLGSLQARIATAEQDLHAIQAESFVADPPPVRCAACGAGNDVGAHFCHQCGLPLGPVPVAPAPGIPASLACGACGAANPAGMHFCRHCGSPLAVPSATALQAATAAAPGAPASEPAPSTPVTQAPELPEAASDGASAPALSLTALDMPEPSAAPAGEPTDARSSEAPPPVGPGSASSNDAFVVPGDSGRELHGADDSAAAAVMPANETEPAPPQPAAKQPGSAPVNQQPPPVDAAFGAERACPSCGMPIAAAARFCAFCGRPAAGPAV